MSLITNEISSDNETMEITEGNKRKFHEIDVVLKKCKVESPTTTTTFADEESNAMLTDVTDNESSDSSDRIDKPMTFTPTISTNCDNEERKQSPNETIVCPQFGQIVNRREFRRAGPYIIGLKLGQSPVDSIVQYLAKKENTNEFVQLKVNTPWRVTCYQFVFIFIYICTANIWIQYEYKYYQRFYRFNVITIIIIITLTNDEMDTCTDLILFLDFNAQQ